LGSVIPFPVRAAAAPAAINAANALTCRLVGSIQREFAVIAGSVRTTSRALEDGLRSFSSGLGEAKAKIEQHAVFLREIQDATELAERDPEAAAVLLAELRRRAAL